MPTSLNTSKTKYYLTIASIAGNVTSYKTKELTLSNNNEILLATGTATTVSGVETATILNLRFSAENEAEEYLPEGVIINSLQYRIDEQ